MSLNPDAQDNDEGGCFVGKKSYINKRPTSLLPCASACKVIDNSSLRLLTL